MIVLRAMMITTGLALISLAVGAAFLSSTWAPALHKDLEARLGVALGTEVTIGKIRPAWAEGALALEDVVIKNPEKFKAGPAVSCARILVHPEFNSLLSKTPVIANVTLQDMEMRLRYEIGDGTNLGYLSKQARQAAEIFAAKPEGGFIIREVKTEGAKLNFAQGPKLDIPIDPIEVDMPIPPAPTQSTPQSNLAALPPIPQKEQAAGGTFSDLLQGALAQAAKAQGLLKPLADLLQAETAPATPPTP